MSRQIFLDPDITSPWEPSEGDPSNMQSISPFSVPDYITAEGTEEGKVDRIAFRYAGGEKRYDWEPMDDEVDPLVKLRISQLSGTILELTIFPGANTQNIRSIASRLEKRARSIKRTAKRFSFLMISRLLEQLAEDIVR